MSANLNVIRKSITRQIGMSVDGAMSDENFNRPLLCQKIYREIVLICRIDRNRMSILLMRLQAARKRRVNKEQGDAPQIPKRRGRPTKEAKRLREAAGEGSLFPNH